MISVINDEVSNNIEELIELLNQVNVKNIELRKIESKYLFEIQNDLLKKYSNWFNKNNISVSLIDSPIGKHKFSFEEEEKLLLIYINVCKIFNCNRLRIFSDVGEDIIKTLKNYNQIALENSITLYIENEPKTFCENYDNILKIMENNFSNIKVLFDPENYYSCNVDYNIAMEKLYKYIDYVHIRDTKNNMYVNLFEGEIDIKKILTMFKDKYISLETHLPMISNEPKKKLFIENIRRINYE